jgi:uncharacterized protein YcnI
MLKSALALCALLAGTTAAGAHITLEKDEAPVGASYKAVFRVTHGCDGAPTIGLRIVIPEGLVGVKPMPKPGWRIGASKSSYARAYEHLHGRTLSEGVTEVTWRGGELPNDFVDEFALFGFVAREMKGGETLRFPVTQECAGGKTVEWSEVPKNDGDHPDRPAPGLTLTEPDEHAHH